MFDTTNNIQRGWFRRHAKNMWTDTRTYVSLAIEPSRPPLRVPPFPAPRIAARLHGEADGVALVQVLQVGLMRGVRGRLPRTTPSP